MVTFTIDAGGEQAWRFVWSVPSECSMAHQIRFRATDYAGNVTTSGWYDMVVDTTPGLCRYLPLILRSAEGRR